jgi:hypothetical protein
MTGALTWDLARASGLVAFLLLTASVSIGIALSLGWRTTRWNRFVTNEVHRFVTLLSLLFLVLHGVAIVVDPFIKMSVTDVLIPFTTTYRPLWVGLGILGGYLVAAVYFSERVRSRIGYAWWRRFHGLAFGAFLMTLLHGIATGSDTSAPWALALYGGSALLVAVLLGLRLLPAPPARRRPLVAVLAGASLVAVVFFTVSQPLQPGWSARAGGTIPDAVTAATTTTSSGLGVTESKPLTFDGQIARSEEAIQLTGETQDGKAAFRVQLSGNDGGIGGQVVLNTGTAQVCEGPVTQVGDTTIDATCSMAGGTWSLRIAVLSASQSQISGTLEITPRS